MIIRKFVFLCALLFLFACNNKNGDGGIGDKNTVQVNFFNESSFKVDIYRNINPSRLDASTRPIATISPSSTVKVKLPPSENQMIGDVFYIRYYVQLADSFASGIDRALYVQAERDISNIAFVLKEGKTYTKTIAQPERNQLRFINGYIKVQNTGSKSFQVANGDVFLKKIGTAEPNLASGKFGFYELAIPSIDESINIASLKFFVTADGNTCNVPSFLLERGKVYEFQFNGSQITGPSVQDIAF